MLLHHEVYSKNNQVTQLGVGDENGKALVILHGLFGSGSNWRGLSKILSKNFNVITIDLRNHGQSDHSKEWDYEVMASDVIETIDCLELSCFCLLGHSMGGKVAMQLASMVQEKQCRSSFEILKLIILDIAPKNYDRHHDDILEGLNSVDCDSIGSRGEAEKVLMDHIKGRALVSFLLKSLRPQNGRYLWQFNLPVITSLYENILSEPEIVGVLKLPTLFLKGSLSDYILNEDEVFIKRAFSNVSIKEVSDAGHWLHAEQPEIVLSSINEFCEE